MEQKEKRHKRLSPLSPEARQTAEQRRANAVMGALKAIHSATSPDSMDPGDLERQRKGQELLGRLVAPMLGMSWEPFDLDGMPAAWVRPERGHDKRRVTYTAMAADIPAETWAMPGFWPPSWPVSPAMRFWPLHTVLHRSTPIPRRWRTP